MELCTFTVYSEPYLHRKLGTTNTHSLHQIHITREIHQFYTFLKTDFEKYTGNTRCILSIFGVYSTYTLYTKNIRVILEYVSAGNVPMQMIPIQLQAIWNDPYMITREYTQAVTIKTFLCNRDATLRYMQLFDHPANQDTQCRCVLYMSLVVSATSKRRSIETRPVP